MVTEQKQKNQQCLLLLRFQRLSNSTKINYRSSFTGFLTCLPLRVVYKVEPLVAVTSGEGGTFLAGLSLVTDWSDW